MKAIFLRLGALAALTLPNLAGAEALLIARLQPNVSAAAMARKYAITLKDTTSGAPFALYSVATQSLADQMAAKMERDTANFAWVEDDDDISSPEGLARAFPKKGGGLPAVGDRYALQTINKGLLDEIAWSPALANANGRAVRLAILDNGVSPKAKAIWMKVEASANYVEAGQAAYDIPRKVDSNKNGIVDEAVGHGTMVAGLVDQVAPKVRLVVARVADSDGNATAWTVIKGLAFAVTSGAEVANVSLGSWTEVPALSDTLDWCEEKKLLVVAAIGNNGAKGACYPAIISNCVCVGGLNPDATKASFSNWSSTCDVSAPATGVASQYWDGELAVWSGTSFSTPLVSAAVADILRRIPNPGPNQLRKALTKSVDSLNTINPAYKGQLGGLLDIVRLAQMFKIP